jgi:nucleotidyltransferase substrate binding protein (TIGR01987 family)
MILNTDSDIRWKQRFTNLKKAFDGLSQALTIDNPDIVQRAGIIQFFEMSFELSWKTIKDYLEYNGFEQ